MSAHLLKHTAFTLRLPIEDTALKGLDKLLSKGLAIGYASSTLSCARPSVQSQRSPPAKLSAAHDALRGTCCAPGEQAGYHRQRIQETRSTTKITCFEPHGTSQLHPSPPERPLPGAMCQCER